jgi:DNA-binding winged helix-turn-helix (wHTH) protein
MTQAELNDAVAEATGESVRTIRRRGFSIVTPLQVFNPDEDDDQASPSYIDWDTLEREQRRFVAA